MRHCRYTGRRTSYCAVELSHHPSACEPKSGGLVPHEHLDNVRDRLHYGGPLRLDRRFHRKLVAGGPRINRFSEAILLRVCWNWCSAGSDISSGRSHHFRFGTVQKSHFTISVFNWKWNYLRVSACCVSAVIRAAQQFARQRWGEEVTIIKSSTQFVASLMRPGKIVNIESWQADHEEIVCHSRIEIRREPWPWFCTRVEHTISPR